MEIKGLHNSYIAGRHAAGIIICYDGRVEKIIASMQGLGNTIYKSNIV